MFRTSRAMSAFGQPRTKSDFGAGRLSAYDPKRTWCRGAKADICAAISHVRSYAKSGHVQCKKACPLYPQKRTLIASNWMSAKGQSRTLAHPS